MLMLLFCCGSSYFAIDCNAVLEVFPKVSLQKIPGQEKVAPDYLVGLFNYGGKPIPVIDICQYIEKQPCSNAMHSRLILIENPLIALLAEKVMETKELNPERFLPSGLHFKSLPFLGGVLNEGERAIQRFDLPAFCQAIQHLLT